MSLLDKLKKIEVPSTTVTVCGIRFKVSGKSLLDGSKITADATAANKKRAVKLPVDAFWLAHCVQDAEDGSTLTAEEWSEQPKQLTGPLLVETMRVNSLDDEDVERDPKDSSTTAT